MEDSKIHISFVSPVYNSENILHPLIVEIKKVMLKINHTFEIILVDDRSTDNSWEEMQSLASEDSNLINIRLSRNFGQYPATLAGLSYARGEWIVVLDCDLQDQPKEVLKLFLMANKGFDVVLAKRNNRQDNYLKKLSSLAFSKVYGFLTDTNHDHQVANFGIYRKKVISSILSMTDYYVNFPLFVNFVGFNQTSIQVEHGPRFEGGTTYTYSKLFELALNSMISFSNKPLRLMVKFGIIVSFISLLFGMYNVYLSLTGQIEVLGYSSIIVSIWFLSGIIITLIGVCGIYIGKIFDQSKNRPIFIIDDIK